MCRDELVVPAQKRLKPDAVPTILYLQRALITKTLVVIALLCVAAHYLKDSKNR